MQKHLYHSADFLTSSIWAPKSSSRGLKNRKAQLEHTLLACEKTTFTVSFCLWIQDYSIPKKELASEFCRWLYKPKLPGDISQSVCYCETDTWLQPVSPRTPWEWSCRSCEAGRSRELWRIHPEEVWNGCTLPACWWRCCSWPQLSVAAGHPDLGEHCCGLYAEN